MLPTFSACVDVAVISVTSSSIRVIAISPSSQMPAAVLADNSFDHAVEFDAFLRANEFGIAGRQVCSGDCCRSIAALPMRDAAARVSNVPPQYNQPALGPGGRAGGLLGRSRATCAVVSFNAQCSWRVND
jgi:hypothetical protein